MTNLDKFINDTPQVKFTVGEKEIVGNTTGLTLIKITQLGNNPEIEKVLEIVFGKENATHLLEKLSAEGLAFVMTETTKALGLDATIEAKK